MSAPLQQARLEEAGDLPVPPLGLLERATLFLDFDGTLVDIAPTPDSVMVPAELGGLLDAVAHRLSGRLVLLSGRSLDDLDALLGRPKLRIGASHGLERRPGSSKAPRMCWPEWLDKALLALQAAHPGAYVERKTCGLGLHFRRCPEAEPAFRWLAEQIAHETGAIIQPGKMVYEIRPEGLDKGGLLQAFMDEPDLRGTRPLAFGDDLTDEAAFGAANALGGSGVLVGDPRTSHASFRLADPGAVRAWLRAAAEAV